MESLTIKELIRLWGKFCSYMVESHPNPIDSDYTFENFVYWLEEKEQAHDY